MLHKKSYMTNYLLQKYQATNIAEFFIEYSDATSHMVTNEENMTNLWDAETSFTVGDSGILT